MNAYPLYKKIGFLAGPILFIILLSLPVTLLNPTAHKVIAMAVWMVMWWITEAVALPVTALLPLVVLPMLNIEELDIQAVATRYGHPIVFLFFGGFVLALALEKVNLHRRIALTIIRITGTNADGIVFGFMVATALLSMWISNTASTVVMLPIALSVINLLVDVNAMETKHTRNFALSIMLGIAFAANIGGTATLIGTPPNVVMAGFLEDEYQMNVSFLNWMAMGVPFATVLLLVNYLIIVKVLYPNRLGRLGSSQQLIRQELQKLGKLSGDEKSVLVVFVSVALLWIFRTQVNTLLPMLRLTDAGISMLGAVALFAIPLQFREGKFILSWADTVRLPWGILLLFGGGLALASALSAGDIINIIGEAIAQREGLRPLAIIALLITVMLFMTELMSNVALVAIFIPVVAGIALGIDLPILHVVIPVTLAASCAFMLPMATPPNAIVFASGHIKVYQMVRVGIILNVLSILLLILLANIIIPKLF